MQGEQALERHEHKKSYENNLQAKGIHWGSSLGLSRRLLTSALIVAEYPRLRLIAVCLVPAQVAQPSGFDSRHCVAAAGTFASVVRFASNLLCSSASIFE